MGAIAALVLAACSSGSGTTGTGGGTAATGGVGGQVAGGLGGAAAGAGGAAATGGPGGQAAGGQGSGAAGTGGAAGIGVAVGGGAAGTGGAGGQAGGGACGGPIIDPEQRTGTPNFTTVAWAIYVAPLGTQDTPLVMQAMSPAMVFAPKHAFDTALGTFKSVVPHGPPYDDELAVGLAQTTFVNTGCVPASALQAPSAIFIAAIVAASPTAPIGTSYEVPTPGPIIPGALSYDGALLRDGVVVDPAFGGTYLTATQLYGTVVDGYRHMLFTWGENTAFDGGAALTAGNYTYRFSLSDSSGSTSQTIHFTVY